MPHGSVANERVRLNLGRLDLGREIPHAVERGEVKVHDRVRRGVHAEVLRTGLCLRERTNRHDHVPVPGVGQELGPLQTDPFFCKNNKKKKKKRRQRKKKKVSALLLYNMVCTNFTGVTGREQICQRYVFSRNAPRLLYTRI